MNIIARYAKAKIAARQLKQLSDQNPGYIIFVAIAGLGDICYAFSFLEALKRKRDKKVIVLCKEYLYELIKCYVGVDEIRVLTPKQIENVKCLNHTTRFCRTIYNDKVNDSRIYNCDQWFGYNYSIVRFPGIDYIDVQRYMFYDIDESAPLTLPDVPDIDVSKFCIDYEKAIIINPVSFSLNTNNALFENIIGVINNAGYTVYMNVTGDQMELNGTIPLRCSITELYSLTKRVKAFISTRSGILDFMIGNGGTFLTIYERVWDGYFRKAYTLNAWNTSSIIYEFYDDEEEAIITKIHSLINNDSQSER